MTIADAATRATATTPDFTTLQIGTIVGRASLGGGERYYFDLLRTLPQVGVGVRGLIVGDPRSIEAPVDSVESFAPDAANRWQRWVGLRHAVARTLPACDLFVSHLAPHTFPVLDQTRKRPFVVHFHHPIAIAQREEKGLRATLEWLEEFAVYALPRRIIVLSQSFGDILTRHYRVPAERITVIPGGVDVHRFRPTGTRADARCALGLPLDRPIAICVRRLVANKGIEQLIAAADAIRRAVPDVLIAIGGSGPLRPELEAKVNALGLDRWVRFLGYVSDDDLPRAYRAGDLSVVPTTAWEGFGLVVAEALACGTPVLVTPVGGMPEVVAGLDRGLILAGNDAASIADGVSAAFTGALPLPDEHTCATYAQRFDWVTIAERVRDVYRSAL